MNDLHEMHLLAIPSSLADCCTVWRPSSVPSPTATLLKLYCLFSAHFARSTPATRDSPYSDHPDCGTEQEEEAEKQWNEVKESMYSNT